MTAADVAVARSTSVRRPTKPNTTAHSNAPSGTPDPYYGHEKMAKSAALFITSLFSCPELPPPSSATTADGRPVPSPKLPHFIAYALHRTRLAEDVTYAALFLLQRLKTRFPAARGSSGHRLFISAFMIASKVICDDTYSNKSWCVVGQGMFSLREINQMEREMCGYLEWVLNIQHPELEEFKELVKGMPMDGSLVVLPDFSKPRPVVTIPVSALPPPYSPPSPQDMREDSPDSDFPDSPSHSDTTSPMSSAPQTPPSQDDVDDSSTRIISSTSPVKPMPHVAHVVEDKVARRVSSVGAFGATRW